MGWGDSIGCLLHMEDYMVQTADGSAIFSEIITKNREMLAIFDYVETISKSNEPVLITGECGSGKDLIARAIHKLSKTTGRFVPVNIAGLDDTMFSDTLFGHVRGAYTGADRARKGLIERAVGGTLFLDEIGDLSLVSQVKLLRLIQEREFCPLGSDIPLKANVRIVSATNRDLGQFMQFKQFRNDLFYRLNIHCISLPPLRERMDDLPLLVDNFVAEAAKECGIERPVLTPELMRLLNEYNYPGNVRELRAIIFDIVCRSEGGKLPLDALTQRIKVNEESFEARKMQLNQPKSSQSCKNGVIFMDELPTLKEVAELLIDEALVRAGGKISLAAKSLGITHQALSKRLKKRK